MLKRQKSRWGLPVVLAALLLAAGEAGARPPQMAHGPAAKGTSKMTLSGKAAGTWSQAPSTPDTGGSYQLSGNGNVTPLGSVQMTGSLHTPGMIANGRTTGTLTLSGAHGTLTLALSGPAQAGFSVPPPSLMFTVTGGTGAYQDRQGTGAIQLTMTPQRRPATIPGRLTPHFIVAAMFSLTFGDAKPAHG